VLFLLCLLLVVWQPLSLGLTASSVLDALPVRGVPLAIVLVVRILVAGLGIAAGLALIGRRPGAVALAKVSLTVSAATDLFVYLTPYFPSNRAPGDTAIVVAASLAYYAIWLAYLYRSKEIRQTFGHDIS
jgi:hypothetical protein